MKWIKKLLLVAPLMLLLISGTAYAKNNVSEIDISVTVRDDGSAYVVQNWQGTFEEGTENYIPIATKDIGISDLKVSMKKVSILLLMIGTSMQTLMPKSENVGSTKPMTA